MERLREHLLLEKGTCVYILGEFRDDYRTVSWNIQKKKKILLGTHGRNLIENEEIKTQIWKPFTWRDCGSNERKELIKNLRKPLMNHLLLHKKLVMYDVSWLIELKLKKEKKELKEVEIVWKIESWTLGNMRYEGTGIGRRAYIRDASDCKLLSGKEPCFLLFFFFKFS